VSGVERRPALPPRRTHPVANLAAAVTPVISTPAPANRPVKDQLNVRISRELVAQLDQAILVISVQRGSKLTKAEAVEAAITDFLDRHHLKE